MQKITCRVPAKLPTKAGLRLDQAISQTKESAKAKLSRTLIRKLIVAGAVYVNGKRVRVASRKMRGGEIIDIYWDKSRSPEKLSIEYFLPLRVLYEDEAVICFDKPPGLPTQPTLDEARVNLVALAKQQLEKEKKGKVYLGMHHRLDKDTSGVILFTKNKKYNAFIGEQFKSRLCSKVYIAVVEGCLKKKVGTIESYLDKISKSGKKNRFGSVKSGGKKAVTSFSVIETGKKYSLVQVSIKTGRTHQIRVHFSEMGYPIVGDRLYGSENRSVNRQLLHAHALTIDHPVTKNAIRIESPVPPEFRKWVLSKH